MKIDYFLRNKKHVALEAHEKLRAVNLGHKREIRLGHYIREYTRSNLTSADGSVDEAQWILDHLLAEESALHIVLDTDPPKGLAFWRVHGARNAEHAKAVTIERNIPAEFCGGFFSRVQLAGMSRVVRLENSCIRQLSLQQSPGGAPSHEITLADCWISELVVQSGAVKDISVLGGGILNISCPGPDAPNPFLGSVTLSDVFLPRTRKGFPISGAQPYRNIRYHLTHLQNGPAASVFHSAELAVERDDERGLNRFFNFLYEEFSDYGASPVLPLIWIGLLWMLTTGILLATGVDFGGAPDKAVGWQAYLYKPGWAGDLLRSVILGFQPISWLGSLISAGPSVPLVPHSFLAQIWLVIDGILSTVLLALFIFALRRRFRMAS